MGMIDTHQHLIFRERFGYAWARDIPALATGDFDQNDYARQTENQSISGTIFMEVDVDETDYQAEARHVATLIGTQGLLGQIAACRPEIDAWLPGLVGECADLGVVGFRRVLHVVPDEVSQSPNFRANLKKIGAAGMTFDLCFSARQLGLAEELARTCDNQTLVLDHCGVPDIAGGAFDEWARGIDRLAALPHVCVKFSGITAYCAPGTATLDTLRPWVSHIVDRFGPSRMLWGSDWPVVNLGAGLPGWIDLSRALIADLSGEEQVAIMSGNAKRVYGVSVTSPGCADN